MGLTRRGMSKSIHSPEHRALLALLVDARQKAGLTQKDVAQKLNRPQSFVAKYEGGERRIDVVEFITVARALGHDPIEMFKDLVRSSRGSGRQGRKTTR
jgi:transcriptional regulator with XRE-family HTH domain